MHGTLLNTENTAQTSLTSSLLSRRGFKEGIKGLSGLQVPWGLWGSGWQKAWLRMRSEEGEGVCQVQRMVKMLPAHGSTVRQGWARCFGGLREPHSSCRLTWSTVVLGTYLSFRGRTWPPTAEAVVGRQSAAGAPSGVPRLPRAALPPSWSCLPLVTGWDQDIEAQPSGPDGDSLLQSSCPRAPTTCVVSALRCNSFLNPALLLPPSCHRWWSLINILLLKRC